MIATYFILKITFQAILDESNRLALMAESAEQGRALKARIVQLDLDYDSGKVSDEEYGRRQAEIIRELERLSRPGSGAGEGHS